MLVVENLRTSWRLVVTTERNEAAIFGLNGSLKKMVLTRVAADFPPAVTLSGAPVEVSASDSIGSGDLIDAQYCTARIVDLNEGLDCLVVLVCDNDSFRAGFHFNRMGNPDGHFVAPAFEFILVDSHAFGA